MKSPIDDHLHYDLSLLREIDGEEYVREVVGLFLETTPEFLEDMQLAITKENWEDIYQKAHKLKSSAGLLQMYPLLKLLTSIEAHAKAKGCITEIRSLMNASIAEYNLTADLLTGEVQER